MKITRAQIEELQEFSEAVSEYFPSDAAYAEFQDFIAVQPKSEIPVREKPRDRAMNETHKKRPRLFERLKAALENGAQTADSAKPRRKTIILVPDPAPPLSGERIKEIRCRTGMSQLLFARWLNVSRKTVEGWEQGVRKPGGAAARLLQIIENPETLTALLNAR